MKQLQSSTNNKRNSFRRSQGPFLIRVVNGTILTALSTLEMEQAKPTTTMMQKTKQFLDYASSNSNRTLTYNASNMVLAIKSDTSYLSKPKSHSRVWGYFFPINTRHIPPPKMDSTQHSTGHKSCHVIDSRSRTGCPLPQCKTGCPNVTHTHQNGAATTNTNPNRLFNNAWHSQKQNNSKSN